VLGPIEVVDATGGVTRLSSAKQRAVLGYLALFAGRTVGVGALIDAVWGERPPETAHNALQVHVSGLRKLAGISIERSDGGYRLAATLDDVDAHRFESSVAEGSAALRRGEVERALMLLRTALDLWRGQPFEGLDDAAYVDAARTALHNVRSAARRELVECLIDSGVAEEAIVEAERLVADTPYDEGAWVATMTAYYHAGRAADALGAFQRARRILAEDLGLDPGPELVALERAVLEHAVPARRVPTATRVGPGSSRDVLPARRPLIGRDALIHRVVDRLRQGGRLVSLVGLGGIGKTSVAIHVAHRLSHEGIFVWFVDLSSATEPQLAAELIGGVVGAEPSGDPVVSLCRWASTATGVVVVDNVEQVSDAHLLIAGLLAEGSGLQVLTTSRRALNLRDEQLIRVPPLPTAADDVGESAAVTLFRQHAHAVMVDDDVVPVEVATAICDHVGGIPLGVELAAMQLRTLTPTELLARLDERWMLLDASASRDHPERQRSLRAVFDTTLQLLDSRAITLLTRLAQIDGPFTLELVERLATTADSNLQGSLPELVDSGVVQRAGENFQVPPPIRRHTQATAHAAEAATARRALVEAATGLVQTTDGQWYGPDAGRHRARLGRDEATLAAAFAAAFADNDWPSAARLAILLGPFWLQHSRLTTALEILERISVAELPDDAHARVALLLGTFASYINRADTADLITAALCDAERVAIPPDRLVVNAWCCLGAFHAHRHAHIDARRCADTAAAVAAATGDATLVGLARDFAGYAALYRGDNDTAIRLTIEAIDDARRQGDSQALVLLLAHVTEALLVEGRIDEADAMSTEAFEIARSIDIGVALTLVLLVYGATQLELGRPATARGVLLDHLRLTREQYPDPLAVGDCLSFLAAVHAVTGDDKTAARIWGASVAIHTDHGADPDQRRLKTVQTHWDASRSRLGAAHFDALVRAGGANTSGVIHRLLSPTS
jgi:DNA-binding SARP family transcriptional activator/predicted ATPase